MAAVPPTPHPPGAFPDTPGFGSSAPYSQNEGPLEGAGRSVINAPLLEEESNATAISGVDGTPNAAAEGLGVFQATPDRRGLPALTSDHGLKTDSVQPEGHAGNVEDLGQTSTLGHTPNTDGAVPGVEGVPEPAAEGLGMFQATSAQRGLPAQIDEHDDSLGEHVRSPGHTGNVLGESARTADESPLSNAATAPGPVVETEDASHDAKRGLMAAGASAAVVGGGLTTNQLFDGDAREPTSPHGALLSDLKSQGNQTEPATSVQAVRGAPFATDAIDEPTSSVEPAALAASEPAQLATGAAAANPTSSPAQPRQLPRAIGMFSALPTARADPTTVEAMQAHPVPESEDVNIQDALADAPYQAPLGASSSVEATGLPLTEASPLVANDVSNDVDIPNDELARHSVASEPVTSEPRPEQLTAREPEAIAIAAPSSAAEPGHVEGLTAGPDHEARHAAEAAAALAAGTGGVAAVVATHSSVPGGSVQHESFQQESAPVSGLAQDSAPKKSLDFSPRHAHPDAFEAQVATPPEAVKQAHAHPALPGSVVHASQDQPAAIKTSSAALATAESDKARKSKHRTSTNEGKRSSRAEPTSPKPASPRVQNNRADPSKRASTAGTNYGGKNKTGPTPKFAGPPDGKVPDKPTTSAAHTSPSSGEKKPSFLKKLFGSGKSK
ncbi:uncharacterized protein L969DRAFT_94853 [Mixia osmundae IAM 14324]|uniref:Uncharacterized protein n=1 Tax=Mixia osmundae (strain CBS 9802 / IAM 14324 / JCM 22182 / KY 12970) TaxID=764103 RepID=G7E1X6_MIXOS|nr:uncharacterized protein L969DRAFT_94853 [Mixia osmundae IAM 14324]KEI38654.1 hypothetical protein L969DRAFT_94853 [Mixia osmundae IAM 14324]GAA96889.1 hypothetical protein E5Q_03562 [Mixia osmundae IAM 14324]